MKKIIVALLGLMIVWVTPAWGGGPVILMGIDAEECGPDSIHGPITVYRNIVDKILSEVTKTFTSTPTDILVIGGTTQCVQSFWNGLKAISPGLTVTFVSGNAISTHPFAAFRMIAVASDSVNTPGGLTSAENDLLAGRGTDIALHVNAGGGLLGFSQCRLTNPYKYLAGIGTVTCATQADPGYNQITPTAAGTSIGITDALDVCCWHDTFTTFPSFLQVLANAISLFNGTPIPGSPPAAIGGADVGVLLVDVGGTPNATLELDASGKEAIRLSDPNAADTCKAYGDFEICNCTVDEGCSGDFARLVRDVGDTTEVCSLTDAKVRLKSGAAVSNTFNASFVNCNPAASVAPGTYAFAYSLFGYVPGGPFNQTITATGIGSGEVIRANTAEDSAPHAPPSTTVLISDELTSSFFLQDIEEIPCPGCNPEASGELTITCTSSPCEVIFTGSFDVLVEKIGGLAGLVELKNKLNVLADGVDIDVKPGSFPNSINAGSGGSVPVAILSSPTFDATTVDPPTVTLNNIKVKLKGKGTPMASQQDVNGDGRLDLVVHVSTEALMLTQGDILAILTGDAVDAMTGERVPIRAVDLIRVVP